MRHHMPEQYRARRATCLVSSTTVSHTDPHRIEPHTPKRQRARRSATQTEHRSSQSASPPNRSLRECRHGCLFSPHSVTAHTAPHRTAPHRTAPHHTALCCCQRPCVRKKPPPDTEHDIEHAKFRIAVRTGGEQAPQDADCRGSDQAANSKPSAYRNESSPLPTPTYQSTYAH